MNPVDYLLLTIQDGVTQKLSQSRIRLRCCNTSSGMKSSTNANIMLLQCRGAWSGLIFSSWSLHILMLQSHFWFTHNATKLLDASLFRSLVCSSRPPENVKGLVPQDKEEEEEKKVAVYDWFMEFIDILEGEWCHSSKLVIYHVSTQKTLTDWLAFSCLCWRVENFMLKDYHCKPIFLKFH